jgi:hypothetical protein
MQNNILKTKAKYRASEPLLTPINTRENCIDCACGEISRELAEFADEHTPEKTVKGYKRKE